jgi:hypothetical protein
MECSCLYSGPHDGFPRCRNRDLSVSVRGEWPRTSIALDELHSSAVWGSINILASYLGAPGAQTSWPLPGNARREPEPLAIARTALDAPDEATRDKIRAQIEPDLTLICATWRYPRRHSPSGSWRRDDGPWTRSAGARSIASMIQASAASGAWRKSSDRQERHGRAISAESVTLHVAAEHIPPGAPVVADANGYVVPAGGPVVDGFSIGWASPQSHGLSMGAKVVKIEANRLELDVPKQPRSSRLEHTDKERGRNFLLSKQRRQHRGAR